LVRPISLLRFSGLALLWGSNFLFIKVALDGLSPAQVVLGRMTLGAAVLLAVVGLRREALPRQPVMWLHLAFMAVLANLVPYFLFGYGEQRITSSLAGVLNATTPLFTLVIAAASGTGERLTATRAAGLVLGFGGVLVLVAPWRAGSLSGELAGQLACLGAAVCYAVSFVWTRRFLTGRGFPPRALAAAQLGASVVLLALVSPLVVRDPVSLTPAVTASILALGVVGTSAAYLLYYRLIADEGATTTSTVLYFLPVVAVVLGVLVLDEPLGWNLFAGTAVVLLGVALSEGRLGRGTRPRTAAAGRGPERAGTGPGRADPDPAAACAGTTRRPPVG
jgi:drug/metabolite transporter (DMT)-like permease